MLTYGKHVMKFENIQAALVFIQGANAPEDVKQELMNIISNNAKPDSEVSFVVQDCEIQSVLFQSEHDVLVTTELESVTIHAFSLSQVTTISIHSKENIMNAQTNTTNEQATMAADQLAQLEALMGTVMEKAMENSIDKILDLALVKQKAHIDEVVKKAVDAAMAAHNGTATEKPAATEATTEAAATETKAAPAAKAEAPKAAPVAAKDDGVSIGKIAAYTAGAAAVAVGGFFAWQKWGSGSSAAQ